jgi:flagellin-like hook-associated protein FlgL
MQVPRSSARLALSWLSFAVSAPFLLCGQTLGYLTLPWAPVSAGPTAGTVFVPYPDGLRLIAVAEGSLRGTPLVQPFDLPETWNGLPLLSYRNAVRLLKRVEGGIEKDAGSLEAMRELAIQVALLHLDDQERERLDVEFHDHIDRVRRVSDATFLGIRPLGGSPGVYAQDPPPGDRPIFIELTNLSPTALGLSGASFHLTSVSNATAAVAVIDTAIDSVARSRGESVVYNRLFERAPRNGGLQETEHLLERMRETAVQAASGVLNSGDRSILDLFFQSDVHRIHVVSDSVNYQGIRLLDGETDVLLEGPPPAHVPVFLDLPDASVARLGLSGATLDLTTTSNASFAVQTIDTALDRVADYRRDLAAARASLLSNRLHIR